MAVPLLQRYYTTEKHLYLSYYRRRRKEVMFSPVCLSLCVRAIAEKLRPDFGF